MLHFVVGMVEESFEASRGAVQNYNIEHFLCSLSEDSLVFGLRFPRVVILLNSLFPLSVWRLPCVGGLGRGQLAVIIVAEWHPGAMHRVAYQAALAWRLSCSSRKPSRRLCFHKHQETSVRNVYYLHVVLTSTHTALRIGKWSKSEGFYIRGSRCRGHCEPGTA